MYQDDNDSPDDTGLAADARGAAASFSYVFGPFQLQPAQQQLWRHQEAISLGGIATAILLALLEQAGALVTQETLIARAWPGRVVADGNLRVHVAAIRKVLGDTARYPLYISNSAGRGYRFVAPVQRREDHAGDRVHAAASRRPHRNMMLAPRTTATVGRRTEIEAVMALLTRHRLVTIAGAGGVGKTTIAVAAAQKLARQFGDGACFIDLSNVSDPTSVPFVAADALNLAIDPHRPVASLAERLARTHALLIFDNCEHLIEKTATVVDELLKSSELIRVLATSHEALLTQGEHLYRLMPFDLPDGAETYSMRDALARLPAVSLFVEHARANDDRLVVRDDDVPRIIDICRRLDGVPLAIEIAAASVNALGLDGLAARLDRRFDILTAGRRTAAPRQRTLRNMADWSHANLELREQRVLRRLSVFTGEFSLGVACQVARDETLSLSAVADSVTCLVRKSLLHTSGSSGTLRYRLLHSTRHYAAEKLDMAGETLSVRRLHRQIMGEAVSDEVDRIQPRWAFATGPAADAVPLGPAKPVARQGNPARPAWDRLETLRRRPETAGLPDIAIRPGAATGQV